MIPKKVKAARRHNGTALGKGNCSAALSNSEFSARPHLDQSAYAVEMMVRRFGLAPATALACAEAFGFGGAVHG